ncbi:MAG: DUF177 domain-containing protein [Cyclobacteriaceae bacterium]|nr:DUF177 domain-containing protein [Cyclobacteriaceae bacterium HetDA_MAG_MS6]
MSSSTLRDFEINIYSLSNKGHDFRYIIDESFFQLFPESILEKGDGVVNLTLEKSETMMSLNFDIKATLELLCDVSVEQFEHQVELQQKLVIKFGEEEMELSEDMIVIPWETQQINVAKFIYEYLNLSVPMKKVHPKLQGRERPEILYSSEADNAGEEEIDPRWEALKKLNK